ncbi:MAG TPA: hypothetical protein VF950_03610 [Planctomycetota bacterium]
MAGLGAAFTAPLAAAGCLALDGLPPPKIFTHPVVVVGSLSAATLGLIGCYLGNLKSHPADPMPVVGPAMLAAVAPGILGFFALPGIAMSASPALGLAGLLVFVLPGPLAAASTAYARTLTRESHGTS